MSAIKKEVKTRRLKQPHPVAVINNDLKKYLTHPVVLKKAERAKKVLDNFDFSK